MLNWGACERVIGYGLPDCHTAGARPVCSHCWEEPREALANLGRCLRDAGALCEAWDLGHAYGYQACPCGGYLPGDEEVREEEERILRLHFFRPGHALPDSKGGK